MRKKRLEIYDKDRREVGMQKKREEECKTLQKEKGNWEHKRKKGKLETYDKDRRERENLRKKKHTILRIKEGE